jgi:xanthine/uracil permease
MEKEKMNNNQNNRLFILFLSMGTGIGIIFGVSLGTAFDNIGLGISLGISFGAGIGIVFWTVMKKVK